MQKQKTIFLIFFTRLPTAVFLFSLASLFSTAFAVSIIPEGNNNNQLYYKIGGGSEYTLPAVQETTRINLGTDANLNLGNQCGMFNPALSIQNTLGNLKDSVNNLTQAVVGSATGSLTQMPMYFLAQANPTLYNLLNNALTTAHTQIAASVKSCEHIKDQIAHGKNPYQDWATISVGDSWKKHLSLTGSGAEDINDAKKEIDQHAGDDGVAWVQGNKSAFDGSLHAGGKDQPPLHVISDTVKAGYNAMLNRDLNSRDPVPKGSQLADQFASPQAASDWITSVLGDQFITTCTDSSCAHAQGGLAGRGLLPWATMCNEVNQQDCLNTIHTKLQELVNGSTPINKENLLAVSATDLVISPQVIHTLKNMDGSQQEIFIHKLAQEVAVQRLMDKAFTARDILQTGSQIPVIASNKPAQDILQKAQKNLDQYIQAIRFESGIRKEMMSDTITTLLNYSQGQAQQAFEVGRIDNPQPMLQNSGVPSASPSHLSVQGDKK
jgi:integrating conjugative element protein (TIGR03755 family)